MSENDRMERAKRIRRMREGEQADEQDDGSEAAADGPDGSEPEPEPEPEPSPDPESETSPEPRPDQEPESESGPKPGTSPDQEPAPTERATPEQTSADGGATAASAVAAESTADSPAEADAAAEAESPGVAGDIAAPLPDTEDIEAAVGDAEGGTDPETAGPAGVVEDESAGAEEEGRVLEFTLGDEQYCLDIRYVEEIVKQEAMTRVPNTPAFVEGVVDLRGQITTIVNPKVTLGKDDTTPGTLIVVFDSEAFEDQGNIGWVVDDVSQVAPVTEDEVTDPPMDTDHVDAIIDRDGADEFVIWTSPDLIFAAADV